jgi:hypothetical protein
MNPCTPARFKQTKGAQSLSSQLYKVLPNKLKELVFEAHKAKWILGVQDLAHRNIMVDISEGLVYPIDACVFNREFQPRPLVKACPKWLEQEYMSNDTLYSIDKQKLDEWMAIIKKYLSEWVPSAGLGDRIPTMTHVTKAISLLKEKGKAVLFSTTKI